MRSCCTAPVAAAPAHPDPLLNTHYTADSRADTCVAAEHMDDSCSGGTPRPRLTRAECKKRGNAGCPEQREHALPAPVPTLSHLPGFKQARLRRHRRSDVYRPNAVPRLELKGTSLARRRASDAHSTRPSPLRGPSAPPLLLPMGALGSSSQPASLQEGHRHGGGKRQPAWPSCALQLLSGKAAVFENICLFLSRWTG
jgi:hypothetical protein